jgi:hypothetical protein
VSGFGVEGHGQLERAARILETTDLEQDLTVEGAVDGNLAHGLERPAREEEGPLEIVQIEDGLGLQVVDLSLGGAIEPGQLAIASQQRIAQPDGLLVLAQVFDEQLCAIQMSGDELRIRLEGALELVEGLVDPALVPEDLAAPVVGFRPIGVGPQSLVQPCVRRGTPPSPGPGNPSNDRCFS